VLHGDLTTEEAVQERAQKVPQHTKGEEKLKKHLTSSYLDCYLLSRCLSCLCGHLQFIAES